MSDLVDVLFYVWLAFEALLFLRDRVRGRGSVRRDRGSLLVTVLFFGGAIAGVRILAALPAAGATLRLPGAHDTPGYAIAGLVVMCLGLGLRVWAVVALGRAFRTTVEVDAGQQIVQHGPYRAVRHPSYTGLVLLVAGLGLAAGNWISLVPALVLPSAGLAWRILVEERVLIEALGRPYEAYRARTKRLVPGIW